MNAIKAVFDEVASQKVQGVGTTFNRFSDNGNFYLVIADSVIFVLLSFRLQIDLFVKGCRHFRRHPFGRKEAVWKRFLR